MSYIEDLNHTAFNEGFAYALPYPENFQDFVFAEFLEEKFSAAKDTLRAALAESTTKPFGSDTLMYQNRYYTLSNQRIPYKAEAGELMKEKKDRERFSSGSIDPGSSFAG